MLQGIYIGAIIHMRRWKAMACAVTRKKHNIDTFELAPQQRIRWQTPGRINSDAFRALQRIDGIDAIVLA